MDLAIWPVPVSSGAYTGTLWHTNFSGVMDLILEISASLEPQVEITWVGKKESLQSEPGQLIIAKILIFAMFFSHFLKHFAAVFGVCKFSVHSVVTGVLSTWSRHEERFLSFGWYFRRKPFNCSCFEELCSGTSRKSIVSWVRVVHLCQLCTSARR